MKKLMILAVAVFAILAMTTSSFASIYDNPATGVQNQVAPTYSVSSTWTPSGN